MAQFRMYVFLALAAFFASACSIQRLAVDSLADALAASGTTFSSDDDPQLVREALPFSLKLIESILAESPEHEELLVAASSGFTAYAFLFVQTDADLLEEESFEAAEAERTRARKLYLRARNYGLRALEVRHPGFSARIADDPEAAVARMARADVPALYWTAASWLAAISLSKDRPELIADLPAVQALIDRAALLEPAWNYGSIHSFLINYEPVRPGAGPAGYAKATEHFEHAVALSEGKLASPYVTWAQSVAVPQQDVEGFRKALETALSIDPDAKPEWRLENLISQQRAAWLMEREGESFLLEEEAQGEEEQLDPESDDEPAEEVDEEPEEQPEEQPAEEPKPPPFIL